MTRFCITAVALAGSALVATLSGCATTAGPIEVTRFSRPELNTSPRAAISVVPVPGYTNELEFRSYAAAVSQELGRVGYRDAAGSGTIAVVDVQRRVYVADRGGSGPVSVGVGGSTGGGRYYGGSGVGLGIGFNLGGRPKDQIETVLAVTIRDRASNQSLWEGRARLVAPQGSPLASSPIGAAKMAQALFGGFPGRSGETILVK